MNTLHTRRRAYEDTCQGITALLGKRAAPSEDRRVCPPLRTRLTAGKALCNGRRLLHIGQGSAVALSSGLLERG